MSAVSPIAFAWRTLRRDLRTGELRALLVALVVAVAAVTAVGFFTDRVKQGMAAQAGELLAADLVVVARHPLAEPLLQQAAGLNLTVTESTTFRSVVMANDQVQLAEVKAVEAGYPLRGRLLIADAPFGAGSPVSGPPAPGSVWVEQQLLQRLRLAVGDSLELGALSVRVAGVVAYEPDRGGDLFSIGPRVMMNRADLAATELIGTGSLVEYRLLLAGANSTLAAFQQAVTPQLGRGERIQTVRDARPELRAALERADRFLGLAALVSVLLAGVAVATAARRYSQRHLDTAAVLRCLGAPQRFVLHSFVLGVVWLAWVGWALGAGVGFAAQALLAQIIGSLFAASLPAPSALPLLHGLVVAMATAAGFGLPPLLRLREVPPLRVLRRDLLPLPPRAVTVYGVAALVLLALMAWQAADLKLTAIVFGGTLAALLLLVVAGRGLVAALTPLRRQVGVAWRFGIGSLARRPGTTVIQLTGFGLGIMVLLLLSLVRSDLLAGWRDSLPPDAPNQFLINLQPEQVDPLAALFKEAGRPAPHLYPMLRGRLVAIDGHPVTPEQFAEGRPRRLAEREFNLSFMAERPHHNRLVAGHWWAPTATEEWSVEEGIAEALGIGMGSTLTFNIAGEERTGRVTSLRAVQWDSFEVNFFVVGPPAQFAGFTPAYITSFHQPATEGTFLAELVRRFPNITLIDVAAIMERVRAVMDRVTWAVQFVFGFTLLAGLTVLYAAIQASQEERQREAALLRTLGARHRQVLAAFAAEFLTLGLLAGLLASVGASGVGWVLAEQVFNLEFGWDPRIWWWGILGGTLGIGAAGLLGSRAVLSHPPLWTLRRY